MKTCIKCKKEIKVKVIKKMCMNCYIKGRYAANLEKYRAYWRDHYSKNFVKKRENAKKHAQTELGKISKRKRSLASKKKFPLKNNARNRTRYYVKVGRIKKEPCKECGELNVQAHHVDYNDAFNIIWLCGTHHRVLEGKQKYFNETNKQGA